MSGYRTYIMGSNAIFFDRDLIASLKGSRQYRSNWRVLHIDGFEHGSFFDTVRMPITTGMKYQFFTYAKDSNDN